LTILSETFPQSQINKKLDSDDQRVFDGIVGMWTKGVETVGITSCEEIDCGISAVIAGGGKFEPSMPEFLKLCKPKRLHPSHIPKSENEASLDAKRLEAPDWGSDGEAKGTVTKLDVKVDKELDRIGMERKEGESKHDYAMRCKAHLQKSRYSKYVCKKNTA
jgi:hypothetical protein